MSKKHQTTENKIQKSTNWLLREIVSQKSEYLSDHLVSKTRLSLGLLLVVLCLVVYIPAMRAGFIWEDDPNIQNNQTLRSANGLQQIWFQIDASPQYYPMTYTTYSCGVDRLGGKAACRRGR